MLIDTRMCFCMKELPFDGVDNYNGKQITRQHLPHRSCKAADNLDISSKRKIFHFKSKTHKIGRVKHTLLRYFLCIFNASLQACFASKFPVMSFKICQKEELECFRQIRLIIKRCNIQGVDH